MVKKKIVVWIGIVIAILVIIGGGIYFGTQQTGNQNHPTSKQATKKVNQNKKTVHLIALGDSLTQGVGDQKNNGGYVGIIKTKLEKKDHTSVKTTNYGIAGDRSDQILKRLNNETKFQNNLKNADVIVMTVGGNDLMQSLESNAFVSSKTKFSDKMSAANTTYNQKLNELLKKVRQYNGKAPIFLFSVYNPFYVYFANVDSITTAVTNWNSTSQATLKGYGPAYFVNVDDLMSHGQYQTRAQQQQLEDKATKTNAKNMNEKEVNQIMSQKNHNLNHYISTDDNFHPNHLGYEKMADKLFKQMQQHDSWLKEE